MNPVSLKYCPRCGSLGYQYREHKYWYCPVCLFTYYHNVATSASVVLEVNGSILLLVRNRDPGFGLLSLPGGFIDPGERAEDAALRECREEVGLTVELGGFIGSWPNEYTYRGVKYQTCDLYFSASATTSVVPESLVLDSGEVSAVRFIRPEDVATAPIAFESHRQAIQAWLALL